MEEELIYHGSNQIVRNPRILVQGFYKDFGYGFYCTRIEKQAVRWANTKRNPHIVNVYAYEGKLGLSVKLFPDMTDEWLDFIAACRSEQLISKHGIVSSTLEGNLALLYKSVSEGLSLLAGRISRPAFWELAKFKHPTHQILFSTEDALKTIRFVRSYEL